LCDLEGMIRRLSAAAMICLLATACAHAPSALDASHYRSPEGARALLTAACTPGRTVDSVKGSAWLKAKSKDASGQFPAEVEASISRLRMEVTNLLGGTEAILSVDGSRYLVEVPGKKDRTQRGEHAWAGIPLVWANSLFLGRVPCPEEGADPQLRLVSEDPLQLEAQVPARLDRLPERFVYTFKSEGGAPWPEALRWERKSALGGEGAAVDFTFEDPEEKTLSPKKWEARGAQGEIKVRWKSRQTHAR
jgi:hypothetical protein